MRSVAALLLFVFTAAVVALFVLAAAPAFADGGLEVPDVAGEPVTEAIQIVESAGLEARVVDVAGPKVGVVAGQSPAAGARVERGALVTLRVGIRARIETVVPDVVGQLVEDALALVATAYDVHIAPVTGTASEAGTVVGSEPGPGSALWFRATLTLKVAAGAPVTTQPGTVEIPAFQPRLPTPQLVGLTSTAAAKAATDAGFRLDVMTRRVGDAAPGLGVMQAPEPGAERAPGSRITLYVPAEAPAPSVVGFVQMDAVRALASKGFGSRFDPRPARRLDARVVAQRPAAGMPTVVGVPVVLRFEDDDRKGGPIWNAAPARFTSVPALAGMVVGDAKRALEAAGFVAVSAAGDEARVTWQSRAPRAQIQVGAAIRFGTGAKPEADSTLDASESAAAAAAFRRAAGIREKPLDKRLRDRR